MAVTVNIKRPAEVRTGSLDFKNFPEIVAGDTLSTVTSVAATPAGLTLGSGSISGTQVQTLMSSGTDGVLYTITATAVTTGGKTLVAVGQLAVNAS